MQSSRKLWKCITTNRRGSFAILTMNKPNQSNTFMYETISLLTPTPFLMVGDIFPIRPTRTQVLKNCEPWRSILLFRRHWTIFPTHGTDLGDLQKSLVLQQEPLPQNTRNQMARRWIIEAWEANTQNTMSKRRLHTHPMNSNTMMDREYKYILKVS